MNLDADKDYSLQIVAVDTSGNVSEKSGKTNFRTRSLLSAPLTPEGLVASPFFEGVTLSWLPSTGASEYSIYSDGHFLVKTNSTFIKFSGLENGQSYSYQVMASNDIGDSALSASVFVVPQDNLPVDVSLGYDLSDLAKGTSNWFASTWPILAFCVSIPLGFYVGNRIKGLFVS
ncbi:Exochitinase 1 precursor [compost metagenome]